MYNTISATKARERFSEIINRVLYLGEEFIIEKQGKPAARIIKADTMKQQPTKKIKGTDFLFKLATYNLKGAPKDLAENHDKYTWE